MSRKTILITLLALIALGGAYALLSGTLKKPQAAPAQDATVVTISPEVLAKLTQERILGNPSAPIKITEHASLTCSHCAHFHKDTMEAFKKAYIDTGKAYLVFSDFPLNAPALHAAMVARCIPEGRYFDFIHLLYAEQEKWAYEASYVTYLKTKAKDFGLDEAGFDSCLKTEALQNALLERIKAVQKQWDINSTPSFVVNNRIVISGALPFDEFDKKIQEALVEIKK